MKKKLKIVLVIFIIFIISGSGTLLWYYYPKTQIHVKGDYQNPFLFNNGTLVDSIEDWRERREEIKDLLLDIEYGNMPDHPDKMSIEELFIETREDGSIYKEINITIIPNILLNSVKFAFILDLYIPIGEGPFPVIVKVSPDGTGSQVSNNQTITDRGYIYACYHHEDLDPDIGGIIGPAQQAYPEYDWGTLAVWAWGGMRVADYLLAEPWVESLGGFPNVNNESLIIIGHSRRGKTALLAGALDERFAMVDCNGGCAGGAGSYLVLGKGAESLADITSKSRFYYWFQEDFGQYANKENQLPFDQHFLRSLVAPRLMISTDGIDDDWANPLGVQGVCEASQHIFDYLNVSNHNAIHFRAGGHGFLEEDFSVILNYADKFVLNKSGIQDNFYMKPFEFDFPIDYVAPN